MPDKIKCDTCGTVVGNYWHGTGYRCPSCIWKELVALREVLRECRNLMAGCFFGPERTRRLRDRIKALLAGEPESTEPAQPHAPNTPQMPSE